MQRRQRKNDSLGLSAEQRKIVNDSIDKLSGDLTSDSVGSGAKLSGLFYHPNGPCRTLSMAMSAGFDAVHGREDNARAKLQRALDLVALIAPEGKAHDLVTELVDAYGEAGDMESFLGLLREKAIPYLVEKLEQVEAPVAKDSSAAVRPHSIEDGEALPSEIRTPNESVRFFEEPPPEALTAPAEQQQHDEEQEGGPPVESALIDEELDMNVDELDVESEASEDVEDVQDAPSEDVELEAKEPAALESAEDEGEGPSEAEEPAADEANVDSVEDGATVELDGEETSTPDETVDATDPEPSESQTNDFGISAEEETQALEAAKVAMEANYSDVALKPTRRFDPDVDLENTDNTRSHRRRNKSAEGLEWRASNAKASLPSGDEVASATVAAEGATGYEGASEDDSPLMERKRVYKAEELPEGMLELCRMLLRDIREAELTGDFQVNVRISPDDGLDRPRRRRRRRRPRSRSSE